MRATIILAACVAGALAGGSPARAKGENYQNANLRGRDLRGRDLSGADLRGADLTGANLRGTDLTGARYDARTRWPSGFVPRGASPEPGAATGPEPRLARAPGRFGPESNLKLYREAAAELTVPEKRNAELTVRYDAAFQNHVIVYDAETLAKVWESDNYERAGGRSVRLPGDKKRCRKYLITSWHRTGSPAPGRPWYQSRMTWDNSGANWLDTGFEDGLDRDYNDAQVTVSVK